MAGALGLLPPLLYGLASGWDEWLRRWPGVIPLVLAPLLLLVVFWAACNPTGPGTLVFVGGVAVSVSLGWWGYTRQRRGPRASPVESLLATLAAPAPPGRTLRPEDVLGAWQFYVDAATSMVIVDLQPDGRYTQVIVGNRGERQEGPGGTWTLEGAQVELSAYRSAVRAMTDRARWLFGEWQRELVLFAQDDPAGPRRLLGQRRYRR